MKPAQTLIESLENTPTINTQGDLRKLVANSMLALARKQISATDLEAMSKGLSSISESLNAEIKVAKMTIELRDKGGNLGQVAHLGNLIIGTPDAPSVL